MPDHVAEKVRNDLSEMGAEEQADTLDEEEAAIVMEIAEMIEEVGNIGYQLLEIRQRRNY